MRDPDAERFYARPIPLSGTLSRAVAAFIRDTIDATEARAGKDEADVAAYLAALLRIANGTGHDLTRSSLFAQLEAYLKANVTAIRPAGGIASEFGISERTLHRIFADGDTSSVTCSSSAPNCSTGCSHAAQRVVPRSPSLRANAALPTGRTPREPQGDLRPDAAGISQLDPYFPV
jgi:hypothetical protein